VMDQSNEEHEIDPGRNDLDTLNYKTQILRSVKSRIFDCRVISGKRNARRSDMHGGKAAFVLYLLFLGPAASLSNYFHLPHMALCLVQCFCRSDIRMVVPTKTGYMGC
jgi:hypothetical protein